MKLYTVLLSVPAEIADDSTPWAGTYLYHSEDESIGGAIDEAQVAACNAHGYTAEPADYAVLFVCAGHQDDITPGSYQ